MSHRSGQSRRMARWAVIAGLLLGAGAVSAAPFRNVDNTPFATRTEGPVGAILTPDTADRGVGALFAAGVVAAQHGVGGLRRAEHSLRTLQQMGLKSPAAEARFPRMMYRLREGRLHRPDLVQTQQTGQPLGDPSNELTFAFEGWSEADRQALQTYLQRAYPRMREVYGPPAFDLTVTIVQDPNLRTLQGGIYDASTNRIHMPPLSGNYPEDTFVLCMLVLHAFRDDVALYYDAWEAGMAGAAATVVQTMPGVVTGYDPVDPGPFYCWSVYEAQNQPALGNNTFYPASGFGGMLVWRIAMARAAWLKTWVEDPQFFRHFNQAYYATYYEGLAGDVPGLKDLAAMALPRVEGMSFYEWYQRQHVLDTSVRTGLKLYTWNIPLEQAVALIVEHYLTTAEGDEQPRGGTARLTYWNHDFTLSLYAEEGNTMVIPSSGEGAGEGFLIPTFYNIGGPQRVTVQVDLAGLRGQYPFPYGVRGFDPGQNDFYGAVLGGPQATLQVSGAYSKSAMSATRGVWGAQLSGSRLSPGQIEVTITNPQNQSVTRTLNVGWDSYVALLPGGGQSGLSHTFTKPPGGVRMISLPAEPVETDAAQALGIDPARLLLARWDPGTPPEGAYRIWPDLESFAPGRGFWIRLYEDATVDVAGLLPAENQDYLVPVALGWNMVGSPRRQVVSLGELQVQVGMQQPVTLEQALSSGYLQQGFYRYVPGQGYELAEALEPYEGYWLRCLVPGGLRLVFPAR